MLSVLWISGDMANLDPLEKYDNIWDDTYILPKYIPKENDQEDYLDKIKRRWDSSLLSDDENKSVWDDTWMTHTDTPEDEESEKKFKKSK